MEACQLFCPVSDTERVGLEWASEDGDSLMEEERRDGAGKGDWLTLACSGKGGLSRVGWGGFVAVLLKWLQVFHLVLYAARNTEVLGKGKENKFTSQLTDRE